MTDLVSIHDIRAARERIRESVHRTPLLSSRRLGRAAGTELWLKAENLQKTGAFKARGALNRLLTLDPDAQARGVVTISAGNHAQALAWAAGAAETPCTVVMPAGASRAKAEASAAYGARVVLHGTVHEAFERSLELAEEEGLTFVHPFDDPEIIAGAGTAGLEIAEDLPDVATVVVPVGGGGLIAGVAAALKGLSPDVRVFGVEPRGADAMRRSLDAGEAVHLDGVDTIADGLAPPMAGELNYAHVAAHVEDVVLVSDDEIRHAMGRILSTAKLLAESGGAAAVAALLAGRIPTDDGPTVAVVSGGNVALDELCSLVTEGA